MPQKRVFITGGASGLGQALAFRFARAGWNVLIGDIHEANGLKTESGLREVSQSAQFMKCDVTQEADLASALTWMETEWGGADMIINNAGIAIAGDLASSEMSDWQRLMDINLMGVVRGCRTFIPVFKNQGSGHIVNIASMAAIIHPPLMSAYNSSKAAVLALSETLHFELATDGIDVSVVCPSFFRTNLAANGKATNPEILAGMEALVDGSPRSADEIAQIIFKALEQKQFLVLTDTEGSLGHTLKKLTPFSLYSRVLAKGVAIMQKSASKT